MEEFVFRKIYTLLFILIFLAGCATNISQREIKTPEGEVETVNVEVPSKDPCESLIYDAAKKSRETMKTVRKDCQDFLIEVNPMWDIDYDGTVHVRVYDADGKKIKDQLLCHNKTNK